MNYNNKVQVSTECPTCKQKYTRMVYEQQLQWPGVLCLEQCYRCDMGENVTIEITERYDR